MNRLKLSQIIQAVCGKCEYENNIEIDNICIDTRKLKKGCLYIAINGENFDGHDFIDQAFKLGAAAVISEKDVKSTKRQPVILVSSTKKALLDLAEYYKSLFNLFTVGITGSVGKTSTKEMVYAVLQGNNKTIKTQGNFNNEIGLPLSMFNIESEYKNAVFEMGMSSLGEIAALTKVVRPNVGVITNIGISHIEKLGSRENILKAKLEIMQGMPSEAPLVLNYDDDLLCEVSSYIDRPVIYYGIEKNANITASNIETLGTKTRFVINYYGKSITTTIPTIGKHNVYNALVAFCIGLVMDMQPRDIVSAMQFYKNSGMRQNITVVDGVTVIADCYNASPDSMKAAIDVISSVTCEGRRIAVFGDMLELGTVSFKAHTDVGVMVASGNIDLLLCVGNEAKNIATGAYAAGMKEAYPYDSKEELIRYLKKNLHKGDAVIFKASRGAKLEEVIEAITK